ncbi:MAG: hypothetical protein ABWY18_08035 [Tardiphaga sp.]
MSKAMGPIAESPQIVRVSETPISAGFDWRNAVQIAVVTVGIVALLFHRNATLFTHPQFWAEDLFVYFIDDRLFGASALVEPYNGYVQISCRLIAFLAGFAPPEWAPSLYAAMFVGVVAATAAVVYTSPAFHGWWKCVAALVLLASPTDSEVFFGMCYTQWVMAPVVALALYETPKSATRMVVLLVWFASVGLSSPFTLIATPFVLYKWATERTRYATVLSAAAVAIAVIQLHDVWQRFAESPRTGSSFERGSAAFTMLYRWAVGSQYPGVVTAVTISTIVAIVAVCYLWLYRRTGQRAIIYVLVYGLVLLVTGCLPIDPALQPNQFGAGARYFYLPAVFIVWTILILQQTAPRHGTISIAVVVFGFAAMYLAHVKPASIHYKDTAWPATAACLKTETICKSGLNPYIIGSVYVPTDQQLRDMTLNQRRSFQKTARIP